MSAQTATQPVPPSDDADASITEQGFAAEEGTSPASIAVPRMLAPHEAAVRVALRSATAGRDYTWRPLTDAVTSLGRAAQFAQSSLEDLMAIIEIAVRSTIAGPRQKSTADAVLVYLLRFARQAYFGARAELLDAQANRRKMSGLS
jgi:hypothetical protein